MLNAYKFNKLQGRLDYNGINYTCDNYTIL